MVLDFDMGQRSHVLNKDWPHQLPTSNTRSLSYFIQNMGRGEHTCQPTIIEDAVGISISSYFVVYVVIYGNTTIADLQLRGLHCILLRRSIQNNLTCRSYISRKPGRVPPITSCTSGATSLRAMTLSEQRCLGHHSCSPPHRQKAEELNMLSTPEADKRWFSEIIGVESTALLPGAESAYCVSNHPRADPSCLSLNNLTNGKGFALQPLGAHMAEATHSRLGAAENTVAHPLHSSSCLFLYGSRRARVAGYHLTSSCSSGQQLKPRPCTQQQPGRLSQPRSMEVPHTNGLSPAGGVMQNVPDNPDSVARPIQQQSQQIGNCDKIWSC